MVPDALGTRATATSFLCQAYPGLRGSGVHPLVPRDTDRWRKLYRGRASVERVKLHADLTMLAQLACALARARATSLAA